MTKTQVELPEKVPLKWASDYKPTEYQIKTINDLLGIPVDRLGDCLHELQTSLEMAHAMAEIASIGNPDGIVSVTMPCWIWVDDGKQDLDLSFCDLKAELISATSAESTEAKP